MDIEEYGISGAAFEEAFYLNSTYWQYSGNTVWSPKKQCFVIFNNFDLVTELPGFVKTTKHAAEYVDDISAAFNDGVKDGRTSMARDVRHLLGAESKEHAQRIRELDNEAG